MKVASIGGMVAAVAICAVLPARISALNPGPPPVLRAGVMVRQPGTIIGTAWHHDNSPISYALLRLRNVTSGRIVMGTEANAQGRFTFVQIAPGSYIVELVDAGGDVRAVGQMFSLGSGETVATFIRLGTEIPWFSGFFGNAAAAVLATAASLGVTAVGNGSQPASARF
jgi:hypothetical protein